MSFVSEVKDELTRVEATCSHCDRALLAALVRVEGTLQFSGAHKYRLEISTETAQVARLVTRLIHQQYGLKTEIITRQSVLHKTPNYLIIVPDQHDLEYALKDIGVLKDDGLSFGIESYLVEKNCCAAAYVRGAFLGSGFISDPRGNFHFEITLESEQLAQDITALMNTYGMNARTLKRRSSALVYMKSGASISSFLAFSGAHKAACSMEEERVRKSLRNDTNRKVNAELANQEKAAHAAVNQIVDIRKIVESGAIHRLTPGLQELVRLRLKYPEATLKELGEKANPPLSKSAVYHRVRRLEELAKKL